ncbi:hypothetical protein [Streptomyces sp. NPDC085466]|uniref:hypothetical protein n=1 Tax=Streptomyces sp. NPDC085466 TaxID=3365725 RepID=UPI0037CF5CE5
MLMDAQDPYQKVDFPPVVNGLDYLASVVDHLQGDPVPRDLKFAVLHLQAATEVLLKARLSQEHWSQVLEDPSAADLEKFRAGDFLSCDVTTTIDRLSRIAQVKIGAADQRAIRSLAKTRNALQHYGLTASALAVEARAADVLHFLVDFIEEHLIPGLNETDRRAILHDFIAVQTGVTQIGKYVAVRMSHLKGHELKGLETHTVQCPQCAQFALVTGPTETFEGVERSHCYLCHDSWFAPEPLDFQHLIDFYCLNVLGSEPPRMEATECPECHRYAFLACVRLADDQETPRQLCFLCSFRSDDLLACPRCYRYLPTDHDVAQCRGPRPLPQPLEAP